MAALDRSDGVEHDLSICPPGRSRSAAICGQGPRCAEVIMLMLSKCCVFGLCRTLDYLGHWQMYIPGKQLVDAIDHCDPTTPVMHLLSRRPFICATQGARCALLHALGNFAG